MKKASGYDNPFFQGLNNCIDVIYLGVLSLVTSIPIFTMGASASALYYSINKCVFQDSGEMTKTFFKAFRQNFKMGLYAWVVWFASVLATFLYAFSFQRRIESGKASLLELIILILLAIVILFWGFYLFPYIGRYEDTLKRSLTNTFRIAISHIGKSFLMLLALVGILVFVVIFPPIIVGAVGIFCAAQVAIVEKIFKSYEEEQEEF